MLRQAIRFSTVFLILPLLILLTLRAGDALLLARPAAIPRVLWAFVDPPVHAALAVFIALPLLVPLRSFPNATRKVFYHVSWWATLLVVAAATLIDIDHFIAARSLALESALNLPMRPASHSLSFALAVFGIVLFVSHRRALAYLIFAALASHVLRDATGGSTPVLWPLPVYGLTWLIAFFALVLLLFGSWLIACLSGNFVHWSPGSRHPKSHAADNMPSVTAPTDASLEITRKPW